ncbi:MAG: GGDEF domain-containing protein [Planctomycetota bacterium]
MTGLTFEKTLPEAIARAENLPSPPAVAVEVLRLCEDERTTLDDLAGAVQKDPALAAKMLKLANSSLFSLGHDVSTMKHAAMVLGMKTVKLLSLSFSLAQSLPKEGKPNFDYAAYWHRSLTAAVAGRSLAKRLGQPFLDEAFLCGLLSHLGQLVLAECLNELYSDVLASAEEGYPTGVEEQAQLGFSHSDVAGTLLSSWNLPELICLPVAFFERADELPDGAADETRELTRILATTAHVVGLFCRPSGSAHLSALEELCEPYLGMDRAELEAFLVDLEPAIHETADMLSISLPQSESHGDILNRARAKMVDISLNTSADLQTAERRASTLESENRELARRATTDKLTGLPNRAAFDARLAEEIDRRLRGGISRALGLVIFDVDHFKSFNDEHGHQAGDAVLERIGRVVREITRKSDFAARYGGEEFCIVLPQTTPYFLRMVSNRVREAIEREVIEFEGEELRVTASFGGACLSQPTSPQDGPVLLKLADQLLYRAKENGRNRVEVYSQTRLPTSES